MQHSRSLTFFCVAVACLLAGSCAAPITDNALPLAGKWKNVSSTVYLSDGTVSSGPAQRECSIEFLERQAISECTRGQGRDRIVYAYRLIAAGTYESEVVEHSNLPNLVGERVRTDIRLEAGKLFTTSFPPAIMKQLSKFPVKVESTWIRE